ncbi:MAG: hypothetical protein JXB29_07915, partial [Sedimentisphaerales bacterium]|nr:hypothetical protein [Sedimentisphaerales bacterium]
MKKFFAVVAVLCFAAPVFAAGWSVSSTQKDSDTLEVTVNPATGAKWNDLKIPCESGDVAGDFDTPTTDWAVDRVEKVGQRHYVVLEYDDLNTEKGGPDTITVNGPNNRTGCGTFIVTLNGGNVYSTSRDGSGSRLPGFCSAGMTFSCDSDAGVVTVYFVDNTCEQLRAVGLDITADSGAVITAVNDVNPAYWVYPGSIDINESGVIIGYGNAVADVCEYPDGTLPGLNSYGVTTEMGSLYSGDANAPEDSGVLLTVTVDNDCNVTVTHNERRGGVVLEDPDADPGDNLPIECEVSMGGCPCLGDVDGDGKIGSSDQIAIADLRNLYG